MFEYILNLSQVLKNKNRNSLAKNYLSLLSCIHTFVYKTVFDFKEIDQNFILRYAEWLKQTGILDSTQSFYLRNFRAILNKANSDGVIGDISGWFDEINTHIHFTPTVPKGKLDRNIILKIENLDLNSNESVSLVRDMFIFSFYCGGMEIFLIRYRSRFRRIVVFKGDYVITPFANQPEGFIGGNTINPYVKRTVALEIFD